MPCEGVVSDDSERSRETRCFKYPCSYLIYSEAFDQLPALMNDYVYRQMHNVLTDRHYGAGFAHLSADDRQAILEIVRETKRDLPDYWRRKGDADFLPK